MLQLLERSEEAARIVWVFWKKSAESDDEIGKRRNRNVEEAFPRNEAEDGEEAGAIGESDGEKRGRKDAGLLDCRAFETMIRIRRGRKRRGIEIVRCTARKNGMVDRIDHEDRFVVGGSRSDRGEELR